MKRIALVALAGLCCWVHESEGSLILVQNSGSDHFAFEAENFSRAVDTGTPWFRVIDGATVAPAPIPVGSNNGGAIWVSGILAGTGDVGGGGPNSAERIEYDLVFQQAGVYKLYAHGYIPNGAGNPFAEGQPTGNNDSFFELSNFGGNPGLDTNYNLAGTGHPIGGVNTWGWANRNTTIIVTPGQVGFAIPWAWAMREDGPILDRFVFSLDTGLTSAELNAIPSVVPEPTTSLLLVGIVAGAFLRRRRRCFGR